MPDVSRMREYELYLPLHYNDGRPVELDKLTGVKRRLVSEFGGLTHFPQENEGLWKMGPFMFRDRIVILRVLAPDHAKADEFFRRLKQDLKQDWAQNDVLIVAREVSAV
jgi:hypothetical protein